MQSTETTIELRLWTVKEYHKMAEAGIFDEDERVELLEGKIIWMSAIGTAHRSAVGRTNKYLQKHLGDNNQAWISIQDPIQLDDYSQPEPDIAVVKIDQLDYADHHPTPDEVYLVIEVADTTFKKDCETKGKAYAAAGIADYWVLDVINRQLHVFREPNENGYKSEVILRESESISPLQFPDLSIDILAMLPPVIDSK
ncbi:MAG: Uma2 family endonuclease [Richelia sp. RM2_1_2]|nr:Uma2 family endonuclease [Richelia sp. SM2_1_7]NJM21148.1 Uma2 family endonuclease [Richelia sp. SM1_7_0]NJN10623.1 Uma2 family endonuclease [Richelia sp. RM1_1_1]NJO29857.1 Uma2 family endonuclease [Richelia sp. SL_2_1]NJO61189.1 Uma2 family endonuclease [Richelia sp. RM2_1_2]